VTDTFRFLTVVSICHAGVLTTVTPSPRFYSVHLTSQKGTTVPIKENY